MEIHAPIKICKMEKENSRPHILFVGRETNGEKIIPNPLIKTHVDRVLEILRTNPENVAANRQLILNPTSTKDTWSFDGSYRFNKVCSKICERMFSKAEHSTLLKTARQRAESMKAFPAVFCDLSPVGIPNKISSGEKDRIRKDLAFALDSHHENIISAIKAAANAIDAVIICNGAPDEHKSIGAGRNELIAKLHSNFPEVVIIRDAKLMEQTLRFDDLYNSISSQMSKFSDRHISSWMN